jgi:hypothetical protein
MSKEIHPEDNINISAIKSFLISLFRVFFYFLSFSALVCRTRKFLLLAGLFAGLFWGMFYYYIAQTRHYQASIMILGTKMPPRVYAGILEQLNILAKSGSSDKLAGTLNLPRATADNIIYFDSRNMLREPLESDTSTKLNQTFEVLVGIKNGLTADSIQNAVVDYINSLPYLRELSRVQWINDSDYIETISTDLIKLDSLKTVYNRFIASSKISATIYNDAINPAALYGQTIPLLAERQRARREMYAENAAALLVDPIKVANTVHSKSLPFVLTISAFVGLLLAYVIGMLIEIRKKVIKEPA